MKSQKRAIHSEQKQERKQSLLAAAWSLFHDTPYDAISVAAVANACGLAKGTVYLYFDTKEDLFIEVLQWRLELWFATVDAQLMHTEQSLSGNELAKLLTKLLVTEPELIRLLGMMNPTLDRNGSYNTVLAMRRMLSQRLKHTGTLLEAQLPVLGAGEGATTLLRIYALIIGVQHLAMPGTTARAVIAREGFREFDIDFANEFEATMRLFFAGISCHTV
jgi:AcrR family transcriptional regulator